MSIENLAKSFVTACSERIALSILEENKPSPQYFLYHLASLKNFVSPFKAMNQKTPKQVCTHYNRSILLDILDVLTKPQNEDLDTKTGIFKIYVLREKGYGIKLNTDDLIDLIDCFQIGHNPKYLCNLICVEFDKLIQNFERLLPKKEEKKKFELAFC